MGYLISFFYQSARGRY